MYGNSTVAITISSIIFAVIGYVARALWDSYTRHQEAVSLEIWRIKAAQLEQRLPQFYWPIYLRLQRDNVVWEKILDRFSVKNPDDEEKCRLAFALEETVIMPNHIEISKIITSYIHLSVLDKDLEDQLMAYMRHIDVYNSIRVAGIRDKDPIAFNAPWPQGFFDVIEARLKTYQSEYEDLLRDKGLLIFDDSLPSKPTREYGAS